MYARLELAMKDFINCQCCAAGVFYLRELSKQDLWPFTERGSVAQYRDRLANGAIPDYDGAIPDYDDDANPDYDDGPCMICQSRSFSRICWDIANTLALDEVG